MKMSGTSYRVDETYIKVGKQCKYLYRAVDKEGNTIEFMLSAKRDVSAAKRFFKIMLRADYRRLPFSISVDKNAAYPEAFASSQDEKVLPHDCKLRHVKYLHYVIVQDHRVIKKRVRPSQCFRSFHTAERTLEGIESINMMRKGQVNELYAFNSGRRADGFDGRNVAKGAQALGRQCPHDFPFALELIHLSDEVQGFVGDLQA